MKIETLAFIVRQKPSVRTVIENIEWCTGVDLEAIWNAHTDLEISARESLVCALGILHEPLSQIAKIVRMDDSEVKKILVRRRKQEQSIRTMKWEPA